ncbi:hypothetical protein AC1031_015327 [Aphanomyces cochlioides]|nr:hypothetical protein AC1031_015327 [Aphanomyces cochlioides]
MNGFINLTKPPGLTSHDCVARVRRMLKTKKVGHAGTLDPMATGVLPLAINRATKFIQFLDKSKAYDGTIRFGITTDSDDITGTILHQHAVPWLTQERIESELNKLVGHITQRPPVISALKKDGSRLYALAREGMATLEDVPLRKVSIHSIDIERFDPGEFPEMTIRVACSEGTYIRSIARECGERIPMPHELQAEAPNVGATLSMLHRRQSGSFHSTTSYTLEDIQDGNFTLSSIESALTHLPKWFVDSDTEARWLLGKPVLCVDSSSFMTPQVVVAVYRREDPSMFLGVTTLMRSEDDSDKPYIVTGSRIFAMPQ